MGILEAILTVLGISPISGLGDSMSRSKTLTLMMIIGVIFFSGFALFLFYMVGK